MYYCSFQFAKLWGMDVTDSRSDKKKYLSLESYDSEELLNLLCSWKDEYLQDESVDDLCQYFYEKLKTILK